jgi:hypothetical protein
MVNTNKIKTADGTLVYYIHIDGTNKMHNWNGPAYIPQGNIKLAEYYVFGMKHSREDFLNIKREANGLPWYKTAIGKTAGARV